MSLKITDDPKENGLVLNIQGRIDATTAGDLDSYITEKLGDESVKKLVLDFSNVEYVSSAGLRVLLTAVKTLRSRGGELVLSSVADTIQNVLKISGFLSFLTIKSDVAEALA
jgi:anti-anti-sigma factor